MPDCGLTPFVVALTFVLSRSRTGFRKTDTIINRLIRGAIQTGLFASIFALADLFSFVLHGDTNLYAMFAFPIGRIYTNVRPCSHSSSIL
jgi:thioester reductase-like protein